MRITVPAFTGLNKRIAIQRLGESEASEATDCDFRSGDLRGYLDDSGNTTTAYHDINGVTIFDYTQTQEVIANGDWDIVRSPVANDQYQRCYYSKYPTASVPADTTDYVRIVDYRNFTVINNASTITGSKRLGVPKPADIYSPPTYQIRQGDVLGTVISSNADATIKISPTLAAPLDKGVKLIVSCPGFPTSGLTITNINLQGDGDTLSVITLAGNKKTWKNCDVIKKTTQTGSGATAVRTTTITFNLSGHGLITGDQVVLSRRKAGQSWPNHFPTDAGSKLWNVTVVDLNNFSLDGLSATAPDSLAGTVTADPTVKFSLFAPASNSFSNATTVSVDNGTDITQSTITSYPGGGATVGTWVDAAAIDTLRSRAYCITYVNAYGDESAPSTPTNPFDVVPGSPVTFGPNSFTITSGLSGWSMNDVTDLIEVRLYRTDETGTFRLVTTDSLTTDGTKYNIIKVYRTDPTQTTQTIQLKSDGNIFVDKLTDAQLGEPLTTTGWYPPPQGVKGIISAPNGVIAGFKDRTIYASVPYVPYAYPVAYQTATDADIMGLVATASGVAVLTSQMPYIMIGNDPSSWSMLKLQISAACVSHQSIVDMGTFGVYAGPEGLMAIDGAEVKNLTQDKLTRAQWQLYNPTTIIGGHAEGRYVGSYKATDGTRKAFIFDTVTGDFADLSLSAVGFYTDLYTDTLKFVDSTGNIKQWNRGLTKKPYHWVSKAFELGKPSTFGVAQLISPSEVYETATLTLKLYGWDGASTTLLATFGTAEGVTPKGMYPLPNVTPFRIPVTLRYTAYKLALDGDVSVATVSFASTMDEIKEV